MNEESVTISKSLNKALDRMTSAGNSIGIISIGKESKGVFAIADTIKEDTPKTIKDLHDLGIQCVMLTGDNVQTAEKIASQIGIDKVIADVLPGEKAQAIKELQESLNDDQYVAMVGDGINDAPALAQADIGIAMGTGTDVAIDSGDIVLVKGTLDKVVESIRVSKQTMKIIKQNLFWAFGYNLIGIPIAAGLLFLPFNVLLSPIIASAAMAMSSVSVVSNSLRVKSLTQKNKYISDFIFFTFILAFIGGLGSLLIIFNKEEEKEVHLHAGFKIYSENQLLDFSGAEYVYFSPCGLDDKTEIRVEDKVHLHNNDGDIAHIHAEGVTWVNLFESLKIEGLLERDYDVYLNGEKVSDETLNETINSFDSIVVDVENDSTEKFNPEYVSESRIMEVEESVEGCSSSN